MRLAQKVALHEEIIDKKLHACINFFWNPLNNTSLAFQRNSLLMSEHDDSYGIVCILEMNIRTFFESGGIYWCISPTNLASYGFSSFYKRDYEKFNWHNIFSPQNIKETNQSRSAEFIVFYKDKESIISDLIPIQFIKRILVPAKYETMIKEIIPIIKNKIYPSTNSKVFRTKEELLKADKYMVRQIYDLQKLELSVEGFCGLINSFSGFSEQLDCNLTKDCFEKKSIAHSFHGIGHVTRVMFWVHIICYFSRISQQTKIAILYAAFIHDLCREDNREEKEHGLVAAIMYEDFLRRKQISESLTHSCMNAVIYHCKDDNLCPDKDLVWKVLKDADSLDRGRFGHPKGLNYIRSSSKGCDVNNLRSDIFRESPKLAEELTWMAYWIAQITTRYEWSNDSFLDMKKVIMISLRASLRNGILNKNETEIAD